jgi:hypothetical protein
MHEFLQVVDSTLTGLFTNFSFTAESVYLENRQFFDP